MRVRQAVGRFGEQVAVAHLRRAGLVVVESNWRCRYGEIDVVARDGDVLVVVEVKIRSGPGYGSPAEAITAEKASRLRRLAAEWLRTHPDHRAREVRFDVLAVHRDRTQGVHVEHLV
ncbi:MAG TPA: YraN family protein, partial [Mycobacteriales bacterium]|nr:YraN family protein [Mycobacteriales bacterium]